MRIDPISDKAPPRPPRPGAWLFVRLLGFVAAGIFVGLVAAAIAQEATTGHLGSLAWAALGFLVLLVVAAGAILGIALSPSRVAPTLPPRDRGLLKTLSGAINAIDARSLRVEITLTQGRLHLAGGARSAMFGHFVYDEADWQPPFVRYVADDTGQARVLISQRASERAGAAQGSNDWTIQLNDELPIELAVRIGVGEGTLLLGGLALDRLDVWPGTGDLTVDLGGKWTRDLEARVRAGLGTVTVCLPAEAGVKVTTSAPRDRVINLDGLLVSEQGDLVNGTYATAPVKLNLAIDGGLGQVLLKSVPLTTSTSPVKPHHPVG